MFNNSKKINELQEETNALTHKINKLAINLDVLTQAIANIRGMLNRKLYSGKLQNDDPDWLASNLEIIGAKQKDKNPTSIGL